MGRLEGKVVFLTGAGAGIAKATAKMCVREGAGVAICELNREAGERAEREIRDAGGNALFVQTDVTQDDSVRDAIAATVKHFGKLNVLFNCAGGSSQDDRPVHEMDLDVWHKTVALNLLHPFLTCRHGIPHMIKAGGGSIVNVTSHLGLVGSLKPAYAATKGALEALVKVLASEVGPKGVRVGAVRPGAVLTEINERSGDFTHEEAAARLESMANQHVLGRTGTAREIAEGIAYLTCAEWVTGDVLAIDGGLGLGVTI